MTEGEVQKLIREMTQERGVIVNCYSQVEYLLGRLIYEAIRHQDYAEAKEPMPFGIDNRVEYVRRLVERPPLSALTDQIEPILARVLQLEPLRHVFVHGYCTFHCTPKGDAGMRFERFIPPEKGAGGQPGYEEHFYRPATLTLQRVSSVKFVTEAMDVLEAAFKAMGVAGPREDLKIA